MPFVDHDGDRHASPTHRKSKRETHEPDEPFHVPWLLTTWFASDVSPDVNIFDLSNRLSGMPDGAIRSHQGCQRAVSILVICFNDRSEVLEAALLPRHISIVSIVSTLRPATQKRIRVEGTRKRRAQSEVEPTQCERRKSELLLIQALRFVLDDTSVQRDGAVS